MRNRAPHLMLAAVMAVMISLITAPATAAGKVSVKNAQGTQAVDPKYATELTVSGQGFQSIRGGHGGIYVFFGTVSSGWRPSQGGQTGKDYFYVPDSESKNNKGFQRFVAFPGSDTEGAANGGTISSSGRWSAKLTVPGAKFKAVDRSGKAKTIDCLKVQCGIITIGAHGVKNANNESFTPVTFKDLYEGSTAPQATTAPGAADPAQAEAADEPAAEDEVASDGPALTVDRDTAVAGRVMTFNATGLPSGDQIVVSLDDGLAAVGPLSVGPNGQVAGAMQLPADLEVGTHVLKVSGTTTVPPVSFAVRGDVAEASASTDDNPWLPIAFVSLAAVALVGALIFSAFRIRSARRPVVTQGATS